MDSRDCEQREQSILPSCTDRLPDQVLWVRTRPGPKLLDPSAVHLGNVEIAVLVDANSVHAPHPAGEVAPRAPGIQEMSVQVVLQNLRRSAIHCPQVAVGRNIDEVNIRRVLSEAPFVEILAILG